MRLGADVVGSPWTAVTDRDAAEHVQWACRLAASTGSRVAMLTDDAGDPSLRTTAMLAEAMIERAAGPRRRVPREALATYPTPSMVRSPTSPGLPGWGSCRTRTRVGAPARELLDEGLPVAGAGRHGGRVLPLPDGTTCSRSRSWPRAILGFLSGPDQLRLLDLVTERAARVLGIEGHGIAVGNRADLCVYHERVVDVLREHARPRWVLRRGKVAESEEHSQIHR